MGIAELLPLLELVTSFDRAELEAVGEVVADTVVDGEDGCGGRVVRVVAAVGVVVVVAVVVAVDDAVSAAVVGKSVVSLTIIGDSADGSDAGASVGLLDANDDDTVDMDVDVDVDVDVDLDVGAEDEVTVDNRIGDKDGTGATELLDVEPAVASFVGGILMSKAVATVVGLLVVDWALVGIAELLPLLELVTSFDRAELEAVGEVVADTVVDGEDGCGGRVVRVVAAVGIIVIVAVVVAVDDAVSAAVVGKSVVSLTTIGDSADGSDAGASVGLLDDDEVDVDMDVDLDVGVVDEVTVNSWVVGASLGNILGHAIESTVLLVPSVYNILSPYWLEIWTIRFRFTGFNVTIIRTFSVVHSLISILIKLLCCLNKLTLNW